MSLLEQIMTPCKLYNHIKQDDPYGGYTEEWQEGASFEAAIAKDSSTEATIAQQQGVSEIFTVVTRQNFLLSYHDVFKRVSDGAIFRVTSNITDSKTPRVATFQFGQVTAEKWVLPS